MVNVDWFFASHRLQLGELALQQGAEVGLATRTTRVASAIQDRGIRVFEVAFPRSTAAVSAELRAQQGLRGACREFQPDLIHAVGHKAILHTALATYGRSTPVINVISGLGSTMTSGRPRGVSAAILKWLYRHAASRANTWTILQNDEDVEVFRRAGWLAGDRWRLIPGSGVDCDRFAPPQVEPDEQLVLFPARLLADKGIREFVQAARMLKATHPTCRFALVGALDPDNPSGLDEHTVAQWVSEGVVEWWGHCENMDDVFRKATVVALPSYREGLPKALIEAAACGRAIVTTDAPGCRDVVDNGKCGLMVPVADAHSLASAIRRLLDDADLRKELGGKARERAVTLYKADLINHSIAALWRHALA